MTATNTPARDGDQHGEAAGEAPASPCDVTIPGWADFERARTAAIDRLTGGRAEDSSLGEGRPGR